MCRDVLDIIITQRGKRVQMIVAEYKCQICRLMLPPFVVMRQKPNKSNLLINAYMFFPHILTMSPALFPFSELS